MNKGPLCFSFRLTYPQDRTVSRNFLPGVSFIFDEYFTVLNITWKI